MGDPARRPHFRIELPEEHGIGVQKDVEREYPREPDDERFDTPAPMLGRAPPQLLDEHEPEDREPEQRGERAGRGERTCRADERLRNERRRCD